MRLTRRVEQITESSTIAISSKAGAMKAAGIDVIDFSAGEPDFPTPENIKFKGSEAIKNNFTRYTPSAGVKKLRERIAGRYQEKYGFQFRSTEVFVSNGAKQALFNILFSMVEEGDEVLIPEPYWVTFPEQVRLAEAVPVFVPTRRENQFCIEAAEVEKKISPRTRMIILNSPNNPSGAVIPRQVMGEIVDLCVARNVFILFDETYDCFVFPPFEHVSPYHFPQARQISIVVNTFSKTYAMTGWRVGFGLAPEELVQASDKLQSHMTSNACSISQMAALEALEGSQEAVRHMYEEYVRRRQFISETLSAMPGMRCNEPQGAFYVFPDISSLLTSDVPDSVSFCKLMLEECRVATVPGSAFGVEGHFRLSYANSMENLREGCDRIHKLLTRLSK